MYFSAIYHSRVTYHAKKPKRQNLYIKEKKTHAVVKHQKVIYVFYVFANDLFSLWQVYVFDLILIVKGLDLGFMVYVFETILVQIKSVLLAAHIKNLLILVVLENEVGAGDACLKVQKDLVWFFGFI